jgi:hypothetical protein
MSKVVVSTGFVLAFAAGFALRGVVGPASTVQAQAAAAPAGRVFEMRTYVASAGRFDALKARFRDHTLGFFAKHNMTSIGYWTPAQGQPGAGNTITYFLAYPSREARDKSWAAFNADPEWLKVREASLVPSNPVARVDSVFYESLDFSPIK